VLFTVEERRGGGAKREKGVTDRGKRGGKNEGGDGGTVFSNDSSPTAHEEMGGRRTWSGHGHYARSLREQRDPQGEYQIRGKL